MKTFIYKKDGETLVSQFTEGYDDRQNRKIFYDWITFGVGTGNYIEFNENLQIDEFKKMIKAEGWKLKEVVN